jgi:tRNA-dihydrouridine synthase
MLTKKTHRQLSKPVRMPPASTPTAAPLAEVVDQALRALCRSWGSVKRLVSRERVAGASIAAPSVVPDHGA